MKIRRIQLCCANTLVGLAALLTCCANNVAVVPVTEAFHHYCACSTNLLRFGTTGAQALSSAAPAAQNARRRHHATTSQHLLELNMGLYDKPLPPRPPPRNEEPNKNSSNGKDSEKEDENDTMTSSIRLFQFNEKGREIKDLLPSLTRRLDTGIAFYFEPQDRLVQNLVDKTSCHVDDACWALEACKGDITEAWTRISTARRLALNNAKRNATSFADGENAPDDLIDVQMQELLFAQRKQTRMAEEKRRNDAQDFWKVAKPINEQWTPGKSNPRPIDDEPWFTG